MFAMAALALGACGGNEETVDEAPPTTSLRDLVRERCAGSDFSAGVVVSEACEDASFAALVAEQASEELRAIDRPRQVGFARSLCATGAVMLNAPGAIPNYSTLLSNTAASWGVSVSVVEEILAFGQQLCPDEIAPLLELRESDGPYEFRLIAASAGEFTVNYTLPDGTPSTDTASKYWEMPTHLFSVIGLEVEVTAAGGGEVRCAIEAADVVVVSETGTDTVKCAASRDALITGGAQPDS